MRTLRADRGATRGSALVTAAVVTTTLGTIAFVLAAFTLRLQRESLESRGKLGAFFAAEAGLSRAWVQLQNGGDGAIGSAQDPARIGGRDYWVTANTLERGLTSLVANARDGSRMLRLELLVQNRKAVEDFAVFGDQRLTLRSYCAVDSYDSTLGSYASQVHADHARNDGNVGSNDDIGVSTYAHVYGYTQHGRGADDSISFAPFVTLWDGFGPAVHEVELLPVTVPEHPDEGALIVKASQPETLGPGAFEYTSLIARKNSRLTIAGPCELVITTNMTLHGGSLCTFDTTNGPIRVYAMGDFVLARNATLRTPVQDPARLTLLLAGAHDSEDDRSPAISFSAEAQFHGTVYAPELSVKLENTFELYGSVKARWLEIGSSSRVHFDESLAAGALDPGEGYGILAWRPLGGARTE